MDRYDIIILGTGAGGGTMLHELAGTGRCILVIETRPVSTARKGKLGHSGGFSHDAILRAGSLARPRGP